MGRGTAARAVDARLSPPERRRAALGAARRCIGADPPTPGSVMNDLEIASESAQATPASPSALQLAAVGGAVLLLVVHFGFTFLHVSPVNPAKVQFERWVTAWTQPVFEQNWKLFAPDPIAVDQGVLPQNPQADPREYWAH